MPLAAGEAHEADDRGFTLIELVVSLTILAIGIVGVIGVMNSSFGVAVRTNERSRAVALATREIEALRAVDYAVLSAQAKLPALATTESRTEQVGGTEFTIEKSVVWGSAGTSNPTAVVEATVAVSWTGGGQTNDVSQSTTVYPGGLGVAATPTTSSCNSTARPGRPSTLTATSVASDTVDLSWSGLVGGTTPVASWRIEAIANTTSQVLTTTHPAASNVYRVEGLSAGTNYQFRVLGISACGTLSVDAAVTSLVTQVLSTVTSCGLGTSVVTPSAVRLANSGNGSLETTPKVSVNTTGTCSGLYVKYQAALGTTATRPLNGSLTNPLVKTADITSSVGWDLGVHTIGIYDASHVKRGSLLLTVCSHKADAC